MSLFSLALIGAVVLLSSFISGVFGFAGGMILLGVLLIFFDVPTAMVLFSVIVASANVWRVVTWRHYIHWRIWFGYVAGGAAALIVLHAIAFVPSKALVYFLLGLLPFAVEALPRTWQPNVEWRGAPTLAGLVTVTLQLLAGNGGLFLDIFFQKSRIDRRTTVVTKAFCQTFGNLARILYFGTVGGIDPSFPVWAFIPAMLLAIGGMTLAPLVLDRMTDDRFRVWTRRLIFTVGGVYLVRGAWLFWTGG